MQAPNIHGEEVPDSEKSAEQIAAEKFEKFLSSITVGKDDSVVKDRYCSLVLRHKWNGDRWEVLKTAKAVQRALQLKFHDDNLRIEIVEEGTYIEPPTVQPLMIDPRAVPLIRGIEEATYTPPKIPSQRELIAMDVVEFDRWKEAMDQAPRLVADSMIVRLPISTSGEHAAETVLRPEDAQEVCQLCGRPGGRHNTFCRLYVKP